MATRLEIVNAALSELGADPIGSFDDATDLARGVAASYLITRNAVLAEYPWTWLQAWTQLARQNITPSFAWQHHYGLPGDMLEGGILGVYAGQGTTPETTPLAESAFTIIDGGIDTNATALWLLYQRRKAESVYPDTFVRYLAYRLAMAWAYMVTDQANVVQTLQRFARDAGLTARATDSRSASQQQLESDYDLVSAFAEGA